MKIKIGDNTVSILDAVFDKHKTKDSFVKEMVKIHPHITDANKEACFADLYETVKPKKDKKVDSVGE